MQDRNSPLPRAPELDYNTPMHDAHHNGKLIFASATSPDVATCPACGGEVRERKRKVGKDVTWFYRHRQGSDTDCPRRYRPVAEG